MVRSQYLRRLMGGLVFAAAAAALAALPNRAAAVTIEQTISREDPRFDAASSKVVVGRNGLIYMSHTDDPGYILRMKPDGSDVHGFPMVHAEQVWAVNADGIQISGLSHFSHTATTYDLNRNAIGSFSDFENSNYDSPQWISGGPDGNFYALNARVATVVLISPAGKALKVYTLPPLPAGRFYTSVDVCESKQVFLLTAYALGMSVVPIGSTTGKAIPQVSPYFTLGDDGTIYFLTPSTGTITETDLDGKVLKTVKLDIGDRTFDKYNVVNIALLGSSILIKRAHPYELYAKYDLQSGAYQGSVTTQHEELSATYPDQIWTAGQSESFKIALDGTTRTIMPNWQVSIAPLGTALWRNLAVTAGAVTAPDTAGGLFQVRVTAGPGSSEYLLRDVIEVRQPGSKGTITTMTTQSRLYYARGEAIDAQVITRCPAAATPSSVTLSLIGERGPVSSTTLTGASPIKYTLTADFTRRLAPGLYRLTASAPGFTSAPQYLFIGPGASASSPFKLMFYGDYGSPIPSGGVLDSPDLLNDFLDTTNGYGINFHVARMTFYFPMSWANDANGAGLLASLKTRLAAEPDGVAPEKTDMLFPTGQAIAEFGAAGGGIMSELVNMDAGLPVGTGFDTRTPKQFADAITGVTKTLAPFPGFKGWDWAANWWDDPSKAFSSPDQKTQYDAAAKAAKETGAWDPILEQIGDTIVGWQTDAQSTFAAVMDQTDPKLKTAASGPYRRPYVYPPMSFSNVDEVDLHYQAEQITTPLWTTHAGAYMKRPGKPAWIHPETFNDSGTGENMLPLEWDSMIGGVDGAGVSGGIPGWGYQYPDWRTAYFGTPSIYRGLFNTMREYGPWMMTLSRVSPVAIPVSRRQVLIDGWSGGIGGIYFTREWEAYMSLIYAHRPADFVFIEDIKPDTFKKYKAIVLVDQTVDLDPELKQALDGAKAAGIPIYADGTCRKELVSDYQALGLSFNNIETIGAFNQDPAFLLFPQALVKDADQLTSILASVPPVVAIDQKEVLSSLKRGGDGWFMLLVNNTHAALPAEMLYRVNLASSTLMPVVAHVNLPAQGRTVYDVFAMRQVTPDSQGAVDADLRTSVARLYAILPSPIESVALRCPGHIATGQNLHYAIAVLDPSGSPIRASLPVRLQIRQGSDAALLDRYTTTDTDGKLEGDFAVPINASDAPITVRATDLVSGKTCAVEVHATASDLPKSFQVTGLPEEPTGVPHGGIGTDDEVQPAVQRFGVHLRSVVLADGGKLAIANAMQWGDNLYAVDTETGHVAWQRRIGQYWAMQPAVAGRGVTVTGFDFQSASGYHLYQLDENGNIEHRFACYGLPQEMPSLFNVSLSPNDPTLSFATDPSGDWVASSGNLGLAAWKRDGSLLWSLARTGDGKTAPTPLWINAPDGDDLLAFDGLHVTDYDPASGKSKWTLDLAQDGQVRDVAERAGTMYILTTAFGGTVYNVVDGQIKDTLRVSGDQFAVSDDGKLIVTANGNALRLYRTGEGLIWAASSPYYWRFPSVSADGRVAAVDEGGTLVVYDAAGELQHRQDLGAVGSTQFLPSGDLIAATWKGEILKFSKTYQVLWRTRVEPSSPDIRTTLLAVDPTPTSEVTDWTNSATGAQTMPPVLPGTTSVSFQRDNGAAVASLVDASHLVDGKMVSPPDGYLTPQTISPFQWGSTTTAIVFDRGNELIKLQGLTFYEDETDPASWLRDVRLESWDGQSRKWVPVQRLLSDSAVHAHILTTPAESNKFRILLPAYSYSSIKLKGIVLNGVSLGPNYPPDVRAGKPTTVIFDDNVGDMNDAYANGFDTGYSVKSGPEAFSGSSYFVFDPAAQGGYNEMRPIAPVTNWLYPISADPQPGQYRYLQLAVKALSPDLKHLEIYFGHPDVSPFITLDIKPSTDWVVYRLDIGGWWASLGRGPLTLSEMFIKCDNGAAAFDWFVLGRTQADLDKVRPVK